MRTMVATLTLSLAASQFVPPSILENGDARGGEASWTKSHRPGGEAAIETCKGLPCFVVRKGGVWAQFGRLPEGSTGKFVLVIGRGSSERVWADDNITGLPYLGAAFATSTQKRYIYVDTRSRNHMARPSRVNEWVTMSAILPIPPDAAYLWLRLSQGSRRGTPHNGSAARFMDVEARIFDTQEAARAYIDSYNGLHESRR